MQQHGTYFEPNIGLVSQNYLENKAPLSGHRQLQRRGLRVHGEGHPDEARDVQARDEGERAEAAHGHRRRRRRARPERGGDHLSRAGGRPAGARRARRVATSRNAMSLGLADRIGALAPGLDADLIAVDGDPLQGHHRAAARACS